jgi:hypothetical protein
LGLGDAAEIRVARRVQREGAGGAVGEAEKTDPARGIGGVAGEEDLGVNVAGEEDFSVRREGGGGDSGVGGQVA